MFRNKKPAGDDLPVDEASAYVNDAVAAALAEVGLADVPAANTSAKEQLAMFFAIDPVTWVETLYPARMREFKAIMARGGAENPARLITWMWSVDRANFSTLLDTWFGHVMPILGEAMAERKQQGRFS